MYIRLLLLALSLACWYLALGCYQIWKAASANSASPGSIVLIFVGGFFVLLGFMSSLRLLLLFYRNR